MTDKPAKATTLAAALTEIQSNLKAPKNQYNSFGKYYYRSAEDILEGVKPHLAKHQLVLIIRDEIVQVGDRYYVKAIAELRRLGDDDHSAISEAYAREDENKKGMDGSQVTGAASSYARKYALNGLFLIDDTKDQDDENTAKAGDNANAADAVKRIKATKTAKEFKIVFDSLGSLTANQAVVTALRAKKAELKEDESNAN